ncbi:MAG: amidohydrolase family protein [Firmicutes bacterium]|nr:amidohydrolase family protein [Bacillota bacterium]
MARAILKNCQIIDGLKEEPLVNGIIVVEDERISWVGQASDFDLKLEKNATIIDMNGMYVLPGLWDMHLHLDYQGLKDIAAPRTVAQRTLFSYRRALTFLYNGVTSLRLVGTSDGIDFALRDGIARGDYLGPRILTAGKGINSTGGHGSKDGTGFDGPYEFRRAARQVVFKGADLVKVMVTGGIAGRNEAFDAPQTLEDEVAAVVEIAHNWGKHVSAHVASAEAAIMCAKVGVDTIEHGYALTEEALETMLTRGSKYVPTLIVTDNPSYWEAIGTANWAVEKIKQAYDSHHKAVEMAIKMGLTIAVGTDVPVPFMDGAIVVVREMEALAKLGAKPQDIIKWATLTAATICGVNDQVGTIENGKIADLIAVPENPYESVSNLRDIRFVMSKGTIARNELPNQQEVGVLAGRLEEGI